MRNKKQRPGKCWAVFLVMLCLLLTVSITVAWSCREKPEETQKKETTPLVVNTPWPCTTGNLTIYGQGVAQYKYGGEIQIVNDGKNGEEIQIVITYPEDWEPYCSCFDEEGKLNE